MNGSPSYQWLRNSWWKLRRHWLVSRALSSWTTTSTLTEREKGVLFKVIRSLQQSGVAILYVTHHLREVMEIGDRVSAMTDGRVTATRDVTADLTEAKLIKLLTRAGSIQQPPGKEARRPASRFLLLKQCAQKAAVMTSTLPCGRGRWLASMAWAAAERALAAF